MDLRKLYTNSNNDGSIPPFGWIEVVPLITDVPNGSLDLELAKKLVKDLN